MKWIHIWKKTASHYSYRPYGCGKDRPFHSSWQRQIGGEIISADSMQVYRHMDIGSAKVTTGRDGRRSPSSDRRLDPPRRI
ncbi:MAG: hypothetical protein ACLTBV_20990 [Enterocloster bolteae]